MLGEIIAIGDELTSGRILNTNSRFAAGQLFAAGHEILAMATIGDTPAEIGLALRRAVARCDFVVVTGGLGATTDDLTTEAVAQAFARPATLHPELLARIRAHLGSSGEQQHPLERLAWLPEGAEVLNPEGRMAGYLLVHDGKPIFFLPGVPHEMRELMADRVLPRLAAWKGGVVRQVRQRLFKIFGLAEIEINRRLAALESADPRVRFGYYPVFPDIHLSITVICEADGQCGPLLEEFAGRTEKLLGDAVFATDDCSMEGAVGNLLRRHGLTLAVAESCSGGLIARRITAEPGSSDYFPGGVVAYSNQLKESFLDVPAGLIARHGAVSPETARAMADGIRRRTGANLGLAVTGIAGPGGGTPEKPVGTVYFGLAGPEGSATHHRIFTGDRWQVQELTAQTGLDLVRRHLAGLPARPCQP